jgi:cation transport ATPase
VGGGHKGKGLLSKFRKTIHLSALIMQVAGNFTFGVMAFSAATFMFWKLFGSQLVPAAIQQGTAVSLALQLSCSVLVST